jgi:hypothetical protein
MCLSKKKYIILNFVTFRSAFSVMEHLVSCAKTPPPFERFYFERIFSIGDCGSARCEVHDIGGVLRHMLGLGACEFLELGWRERKWFVCH